MFMFACYLAHFGRLFKALDSLGEHWFVKIIKNIYIKTEINQAMAMIVDTIGSDFVVNSMFTHSHNFHNDGKYIDNILYSKKDKTNQLPCAY